jgi:regulator of nucleoside diphosphate kinase
MRTSPHRREHYCIWRFVDNGRVMSLTSNGQPWLLSVRMENQSDLAAMLTRKSSIVLARHAVSAICNRSSLNETRQSSSVRSSPSVEAAGSVRPPVAIRRPVSPPSRPAYRHPCKSETRRVTHENHIIISSLDADRLETLLGAMSPGVDASRDALLDELARADIVEPQDMPSGVVTMNSTVRFEIDAPDEQFCLTLAYPKDMDQLSNGISILTPIGTALLGLSVGDTIDWPCPDGQLLQAVGSAVPA